MRVVLTVAIVAIMGSCVYLTGDSHYKCVETKTILSIGGCDKYGNCGVMYMDGTTGNVRYPIVTQEVCTKKERI